MTPSSSEPHRSNGTNGWAIAAFVLGILGGTILSVIFAIVALVQTRSRRQRGRGLAIAALVVSAVWIAIIASLISYAISSQGSWVRATDLGLGDCIKDSYEGVLPASVRRVRCDRPHHGEVFAILPAQDTPTHPGVEVLKTGGEKCGSKLFDYAPDLPDGPIFRTAMAFPTADEWAHGDRSVVCVAMSKNERWSSLRD